MKRSVKTLIMLGVLVVLVGGYFLTQQLTAAQDVSEEAGYYPLSALTTETLTGMQWTQDGETIHLVKDEEGAWINADNAAFPANQSAIEAMAENLLALTASRRLENVGEPADYGLNEPAFTLVAESAEGNTTYAMGAQTPFADGYYVSVSGEDGVLYTVETSLADTFGQSLTALAELETIPAAESYDRLVLGTALDAVYSDESRTIDPAQHWYAGSEPLDGDTLETLAEALATLEWNTLISYDADSEALSAYGLAEGEALEAALYEGDTLLRSVLLGGTDENGDVYARLPGSAMVYTVAADSVTGLMSAGLDTLYQPRLLTLAFEDAAEMRYTLGEGAQEHVLVRTEEVSGTSVSAEAGDATADTATVADAAVSTEVANATTDTAIAADTAASAEATDAADDSATVTDTAVSTEAAAGTAADTASTTDTTAADETQSVSVTLDGTAIDTDTASTAYGLLTALNATARTDAVPQGTALLNVTVIGESGATLTLTFYEYDADRYLTTDGTRTLLVEADAVDRLIRTWKQLG